MDFETDIQSIYDKLTDALVTYFTEDDLSVFMDTPLWRALQKADGSAYRVSAARNVGLKALMFLETQADKNDFGGRDVWGLKELLIEMIAGLSDSSLDSFHLDLGQRLLSAYQDKPVRSEG